MIDNLAFGILATGAGTGITALLIEASAIGWTIRIHDTLGTATLVGITKVFGQALTGAGAAAFFTLGIDSAGTWVAGLQNLSRCLSNWIALCEWISGEARLTKTHRGVAKDATVGIKSTKTRARVHTLLVDTSQAGGTLRARYALGSTVRWRAQKIGQARTGRRIARHTTLGVGTTWRGLAGILRLNITLRFNCKDVRL